MRSKKLVGKDYDDPANTTTALGRCLVDADPEATSVNRRRRNKMFGMSLAIEIALLIIVTAAPILSSVAQPPLHQNLAATVTFFGRYPAHQAVIQEGRRATNPRPDIPNPFPQASAPSVETSNRRNQLTEAIFLSDAPEGYVPGAMEGMELPRTSLAIEPPHATRGASGKTSREAQRRDAPGATDLAHRSEISGLRAIGKNRWNRAFARDDQPGRTD
jgi:hypothetical protein